MVSANPDDQERNVIEYYFHLGYKYEYMVNLLDAYHGISVSTRTLKRKLSMYDLKENSIIDPEYLKSVIQREMQECGELSGLQKDLASSSDQSPPACTEKVGCRNCL